MVAGAIEAMLMILKVALRLLVVSIAIMGFVSLSLVAFSTIGALMNASVISDLIALLQMWCPFNFSTVSLWLFVSVTLYFSYRLSLQAVNFIQDIIGNN